MTVYFLVFVLRMKSNQAGGLVVVNRGVSLVMRRFVFFWASFFFLLFVQSLEVHAFIVLAMRLKLFLQNLDSVTIGYVLLPRIFPTNFKYYFLHNIPRQC